MGAGALLKENARRRAVLHAHYDPVAGVGGPLEREPLGIDPDAPADVLDRVAVWRLPLEMWRHPEAGPLLEAAAAAGSLRALAHDRRLNFDELLVKFCAERIRFDYEYYCAACVLIEVEDGGLQPFVLRPAQRRSLLDRETQRLAGEPIRNIELKPRQYGSTQDKGQYVLWLQRDVYGGGNAYAVSLEQGGAAKIRLRIETAAKNRPGWAGAVTFRGVAQAPNSRQIVETRSLLSIASANNPQGASGDTNSYVLVSEAGKMASTDVHSAERLMTNLISTVRRAPATAVLVESTAEMAGAWYRRQWERARAGRGGYHPTFITWTIEPKYEEALRGLDVAAWAAGWDDYLRALWESHGCTLEQIRWYERRREEYDEPWMMQQEHPTTPEEAFSFGARRALNVAHVGAARQSAKAPLYRARLDRTEPAPHVLRDVRGELLVWREPGDRYGGLLKKLPIKNRYAMASDIGGVHPDSDWSTTGVLDRAPRLFGGLPEVVAEYRGHPEVEPYALDMMALGRWYRDADQDAFWAPEYNSLRPRFREQRDADQFLAFVETIRRHYPRIYTRKTFDQLTQKWDVHIGFLTNAQTKPLIVKALRRHLRSVWARVTDQEGKLEYGRHGVLGYVEPSEGACAEMDSFVEDEGVYEAAPGFKDDLVDMRALLLHVDEGMPPVDYEEPAPRVRGSDGRASRF